MTNLASFLDESAASFPSRIAIASDDGRLTYQALDAMANRVANLLVSLGVTPGDRVAMTLPNTAEFTAIYFGILKSGAVVVPLNVLMTGREVTYHLADSGARVLLAHEGNPALPIGENALQGFNSTDTVEHFILVSSTGDLSATGDRMHDFNEVIKQQPDQFDTFEASDDDTAVILYTSGTTGAPKGAELRHRNLRSNAELGEPVFAASSDRPDTYLAVLPLYHIFGQTVVQNGAIRYGGTLVMMPRFDAKTALRLLVEQKVTMFAGVPTMYWALLGALDDSFDVTSIARNLRIAVSGGSALPGEIHRQFANRFGVTIQEGYGLSETSPLVTFSPMGEKPVVGSIGRSLPGTELKLIDSDWNDIPDDPEVIGEIAVRGAAVMKGYHGRPDATEKAIRDDWFRTGDLARKNSDGYYFIVDRSKDVIIRGGYNVYPREVEEILMTHPAVSLAAVIGVPHESLGEEVKAVIVRVSDDETSADEIRDWAKTQLAAYKYPREISFTDALPMTSTGKILKRELT